MTTDPHRRVTFCPEGRPEIPGPWIELGWRDGNGAMWTTCPCGLAHKVRTPGPMPVDLSWVTTETIGPDWTPPWWLAVPAAKVRRWLRGAA